jgi:hypothetical protein
MNNNNIDNIETKFVDIKGQEVLIGDFIMYPIQTFMRCGAVCSISDSRNLRAKYVQPSYRWGGNADELIQDGIVQKVQSVHTFQRSVIKATEEDLRCILSPTEFVAMCEIRDKIMSKVAKLG